VTERPGMFEQYVHTLIPSDSQFAPEAEQLVGFLAGISSLYAAPRDYKLIVMKPSDRVRFYTDPLTGEKKSFPAQDRIVLDKAANLASAIGTLLQYSVAMDGQIPPKVAPFPLYMNGTLFTENYACTVRCCLKAKPVLMSDPHGNDSAAQNQNAVFHHPLTGKAIKVDNANHARFWIEFEFGKWLLPKIEDSANILEPAIPALAQKSFGLEFTQGFYLL
jgi:hypothetical protein